MEYIDGRICDNSDAGLVAVALQSLIAIKSPTTVPGPFGGGIIEHPFFIDRTSSIWYESYKELEDHINGILYATWRNGFSKRVSFESEMDSLGLRLCPSDLDRTNFMKDQGNRIVALDFGGYSFLPPSFFAFVMYHGERSGYTQLIARKLVLPPSTEFVGMMNAFCALVPFASNDIGLPKKLKSRLQ